MSELRADLQIISDWITPNSRVMDLGCGDGTLLKHLEETRKVKGYGLEIDLDNVVACVKNNVNVIHADLNQGLSDFEGEPFDFVVMTQALQAVEHPDRLINEMLRVGNEGIVTFPNFGHISSRLQLSLGGHMPVTKNLPSKWYNTKNIHLCTLTDFERLCKDNDIHILQRSVVDRSHKAGWLMKLLPNLFGEIAVYRFKRK